MANDTLMEKMLTTIIDGQATIVKKQDEQADDIKEIRSSMVEIVKLEAQQVNQKEALTRMGGSIDKLEIRVKDSEDAIIDLKLISARIIVKVSLIAGGASAVVATVFAFAAPKLLGAG